AMPPSANRQQPKLGISPEGDGNVIGLGQDIGAERLGQMTEQPAPHHARHEYWPKARARYRNRRDRQEKRQVRQRDARLNRRISTSVRWAKRDASDRRYP